MQTWAHFGRAMFNGLAQAQATETSKKYVYMYMYVEKQRESVCVCVRVCKPVEYFPGADTKPRHFSTRQVT